MMQLYWVKCSRSRRIRNETSVGDVVLSPAGASTLRRPVRKASHYPLFVRLAYVRLTWNVKCSVISYA